MSFWKQLIASLVVVVLAVGLWLRFFPGAPEMLESWGMEWAVAAVPDRPEPQDATEQPRGGGFGQPALVVASQIETATINDRLSAIGTGRATSSVSVTPFASGRLTELLVESGSRVEAGDPVARLDAEAEEIALDRARAALDDAEARAERIRALRSTNTATAVQLNEAELAVTNARLAVRDAELTLQRRTVVAPIPGIVGILPVSAGNYVTSQTEIATIDDRSRIVIDFWVPERFAGMIAVGDTVSAASIARPEDNFDGTVSAIDNRIDAQSRTLRIQASITNDDDMLRAGMSFQITMTFPGDSYPAVDPLAIQWGTDGAFVWLVEDGKARRAPVTIIQRNTDSVLVAGEFGEAGAVVTEGIHAVREGEEVRLVRAQDNEAQPVITTTGS